MRQSYLLKGAAERLGLPYLDIQLRRGAQPNTWINPQNSQLVRVEEAVLAGFMLDGWRGYRGEGGLLLNLIKAMSFCRISPRNRSTYIEALYAQNVAFSEDRFSAESLLEQVAVADRDTVERNFDIMASSEVFVEHNEGYATTSSTSMLDFFPGLERWMFIELLEVAGNQLMHSIASKFMQDPYKYRRGWPDITMWKNGELRFVEVKTPGDKIRESQKTIFNDFAKPLGLQFLLAGVRERIFDF